jgi:acyl carrier protein
METITEQDLVTLIQDLFGLPITEQDLKTSFDELAGWDSLNLLRLMVSLEAKICKKISFPDLLQSKNLEEIYYLITQG